VKEMTDARAPTTLSSAAEHANPAVQNVNVIISEYSFILGQF
jgi:hypothetical protein